MTMSRDDVFKAALQLDETERAALVGMLLNSLETRTEDGAEAAWVAEIERRISELHSGAAEAVSWEEVRARLHRRAGA